MPRYDYICQCSDEPKLFTVKVSYSEYQPEIPCPCGDGIAKRVYNDFTVLEGLTAQEKKFGTTTNRKNMADFVKDQKQIRKKSYDPESREAKTNELWTGKEGLDGITSLPIQRKN